MIIDGHMYCFPRLDSAAGYASLKSKMRVVQRELGGHHQPVWRVRDRAPADNATLVDPDTSELKDVEWGRDLGRLVWSQGGETFTKQYMPPMLHDLEAPPELMVAEMDYAGIDMGIIHTSIHLGLLNQYLRDAVARFPDRLLRLVTVPSSDVPRDPDGAIREIDEEVGLGERCGVQFFTRYYYEKGETEPWDDGKMRPFWEAIVALKAPVYFTLQARSEVRYTSFERDGYMEEQRNLQRWMERYPDATVVVTHGLQWRTFLEGDEFRFPEEGWELFQSPRCHLQLLIPIQMGAVWEYPWKEAGPIVKECVDRIGADRLIYGTDMPMVARFCTYRQTLDQFRSHCDFLSPGERADILGGTAARVMGIA